MSDDELVTVVKALEPVEAEIIRNALQAEGIPCELGGAHQAGYTGLFPIDVLVKSSDQERARQIIERRQQQ